MKNITSVAMGTCNATCIALLGSSRHCLIKMYNGNVYSKQILLTPPPMETAQYLITAHITGLKTSRF